MKAWTILIKTKKDGESVLVIHTGTTVNTDIKAIMSRCIKKYSQTKSFFFYAKKISSFFYKLDNITVQINNEYSGCIDFSKDEHSGVTEIKIMKTPIYTLNEAFPE